MDQTARPDASAPAPMPFRTDEQISAKQVAAITGLSRKRVAEAAALGHLTVWRQPAGMSGPARYSRHSAEALARSLVTLATSPQSCSTEATRNGA